MGVAIAVPQNGVHQAPEGVPEIGELNFTFTHTGNFLKEGLGANSSQG
jgi:hypothetical protein